MRLSQYLKKNSREKIVVLLHSLADTDAVASAAGLCEALKNARIAASDVLASPARKLAEQNKIKIITLSECSVKNRKIILVDANSRAMLSKAAGRIVFDCVIDHHSKHVDCVKAEKFFIDEKASSTSEMVCGALRELNVKVSERVAVCLLAGIIADSADFKNANKKTFKFVAELLEKTRKTYKQIRWLNESIPQVSQRIAVLKACQRMEFERIGDFLVASSMVGSFEAGAASALVGLGADVAFVACEGESARISARVRESLSERVDAAEIMKEIGVEFGGSGGGHPAAAGVNGIRKEDLETALARCVEKAKVKLGEE